MDLEHNGSDQVLGSDGDCDGDCDVTIVIVMKIVMAIVMADHHHNNVMVI